MFGDGVCSQCLALRIRKGAVPNPKTAVFDALPPELAEGNVDLQGSVIQKFGDGFEQEVEEYGRVMQRQYATREAVTGGMFLILADSDETALAAAEKTLEETAKVPLIIVKCAASGSKVGAKNYTDMVATTNHKYCPTIEPRPDDTHLWDGVKCIYEIIVSGPREEDVRAGMKTGIEAATTMPGVLAIHTGNYGGKLGKGKIYLHSLFNS